MRRISGAWTRDYTRAGSRLVCQWARSGAPDRMPREATPRRSANVGRWAVVSLGGLCALLPLPGATAFSAGLRLGASLSLRAGHAGPSTRAFSLPLGASAGVGRSGAPGAVPAPASASRRARLLCLGLSISAGGAGEPALTPADVNAMTVPQIKKALRARGLSDRGKAVELRELLIDSCLADGAGDFAISAAQSRVESTGGAQQRQPPELDVMDVEEIATVPELRKELQKRGLSEEGEFQELQDRLMEAVVQEEELYEKDIEAAFQIAQSSLGVSDADPLDTPGTKSGIPVKPPPAASVAEAEDLNGRQIEWGESAGAWTYVDVEDVGKMELSHVKEALDEKGLSSEGKDAELRARLVQVILAEEAEEDSGLEGDPAWDEMYWERWSEEDTMIAGAGKVWAYLDAEDVAQLEVDEVREALEERGLMVEGSEAEVRARLFDAITTEEDELPVVDGDDALDEEFQQRWAVADLGSELLPVDHSTVAPSRRADQEVSVKMDTDGVLNAFDNALDDWFGSPAEGASRTVPGAVTKKAKRGFCPGCGTAFQSVAQALPGYIPESKAGQAGTVCARCYGLQHYGKVDPSLTAQRATHAEVSPEAFKELLAPIGQKKNVVCYVVDVFDFHGSFLKDLTVVVGRNPVVLALNKADLLPRDFHPNRVKNWVYREAGRLNIWVVDVVLVSAMMGYGVQTLERTLRELSSKRAQDVYILGAANVGKSTLVNRLIQRDFAVEDAPWKEEKRIKGKILDDTELEEAMLDRSLLGSIQEMGVPAKRKMSGGVDLGPDEEGWETFRIEGLDLGELEDSELSSESLEASNDSPGDEGQSDVVATEEEDGIYMGPKGEGWQTFKIEGGLDLDLDLDSDSVEVSGDGEDSNAPAGEWSGQTAFEFEARTKETKWERQRKMQALRGMGGGVTTSFLPGTTLGITELDLGNGFALFDTPGLIVPTQLTNRLEMQELAAVLPQKRVEHVTYRVNPGSCVHLGGLACLELVDQPGAKAFFMTIFVSNQVSLHVGKADKAKDFRLKHVGGMISPPFTAERIEEMGGLVPTVHASEGDSWTTACMDVVVSGLGWVALTGLGPVAVRTWAPPGVEIIHRDPLMPFEARTSTESYTGGGSKHGSSRRTKKLVMPGQPMKTRRSPGRGRGRGGSRGNGRGGGRAGPRAGRREGGSDW